ncbi:MAG: acyltransferase [Gemmatimonadetes bacterium]|nr:acyltransferase [Gemmatimonadota bacterium]
MRRLIRYLASMLPFPLGLRASLYRMSGMSIGPMTTIDRNLHVTRPDLVTIGSRVTIANAVSILGDVTAVHSGLEEAYDLRKTAPVVIEDDAYIGVKATILPGIRIGRMATVGANTLVIADVPAYGVVVGVPGRVMMIRPRPEGAEPPDDEPLAKRRGTGS